MDDEDDKAKGNTRPAMKLIPGLPVKPVGEPTASGELAAPPKPYRMSREQMLAEQEARRLRQTNKHGRKI